ncbi:MAG: DsbA family oxidoreductase [Fluviicola sp.]|nr:DsbA family oxidoreductase [Fluviicola sp.]
MKIEIWSDIMCPFCYIGKRHLEQALTHFPELEVNIEWKSFQLDPSISSQPGKDVYSYLAERKGMSVSDSKQMHQQVANRAKEVGLDYHFDKAVIANSFNAHRLIQLAKTKGCGDSMEEVFFKAYFTDGADLADIDQLMQLGIKAGLNPLDIKETIDNEGFTTAIQQDIVEAQQIGVSGVPFFVFDRKYAISGAQPIDVFINTIRQLIAS